MSDLSYICLKPPWLQGTNGSSRINVHFDSQHVLILSLGRKARHSDPNNAGNTSATASVTHNSSLNIFHSDFKARALQQSW